MKKKPTKFSKLATQLKKEGADDPKALAAWIGVLMQYLNGAMQQGQVLSPVARNAFMSRLDSLLQAYEQVATNEARKLRKEIQKFFESTGMLAPMAEAPVPAPVQ